MNIDEFHIQHELSQLIVIVTNIFIETSSQNYILPFVFDILKEEAQVLYKPFFWMNIQILIFSDTINIVVGMRDRVSSVVASTFVGGRFCSWIPDECV